MKKSQFICLLVCSLSLVGYSQTVESGSINSGSLNARIQSGGVTSTLGEPVAGTIESSYGSFSSGFQQVIDFSYVPVEIQLMAKAPKGSWSQLITTGLEIQVCTLNGRVMRSFPAGLGVIELQAMFAQLPLSPYILKSGTGKSQVRMIVTPNSLR